MDAFSGRAAGIEGVGDSEGGHARSHPVAAAPS
jgi:hypothetical protein